MRNWRMLFFFGFFPLLSIGLGQAQTPKDSTALNHILIYKDPRIDYLQKVYSAKNKTKAESTKIYRIQVAITKSRTEVNEVKSQFSSKYPGIPVYISFEPPVFKLRVGTFVARDDAQTFLREVRKNFPASFIVE
ncbi:MAG: SPOR domain-containing protein [Chitinophagales bacterium]|nr:SPOR domain-containing protein [Chitinophagales bacterium]